MEIILENLKSYGSIGNRIEALKALTKLLLHEVESLEEVTPVKIVQTDNETVNLSDKVQQYEIDLICNALLEAHGNQRKAARKLGMKNSTLHAKIRRFGIDSLNLYGKFNGNGSFK